MTRNPISYPIPALFAILLVLLLAFALRVWDLNAESVWHDEGWSIRAIRGPFTTPDDNTPFIYYLSGHLLWQAGAGESPLAFRYTSVLIGLLTVALAVQIARRWYGLAAGIAAGILVGTSPLLWEYSQEVRAYVAVPLVALALLAGGDAVLKRQPGDRVPRRLWRCVFGAELAGLYTHNLAVPLVVWLNVALGLAWLVRRDWPRLITWTGIQIALAVGYIPWLLTQAPSGTPLNTPPELRGELARDIWYSHFLPAMTQFQEVITGIGPGAGLVMPLALFGGLAVALAVVYAFMGLRSGRDKPHPHARNDYSLPLNRTERAPGVEVWLLMSQAILVPVLSTALMLAANIDFHPRYYIAAVPGTLLLIVGAVATSVRYFAPKAAEARYGVPGRLMGISRRIHAIMAVGYALILVPALYISASSIRHIHATRAYQHDDFAGLAAYYATLPEDAVILVPFDAERALQDYYVDALDIQARFVNVPLYSDETAALAAIHALLEDNNPRRVEFLTWFQLPADVRGMYPCLLTPLSAEVGEPQYYYGLRTQTFLLTARAQFATIPATPRYRNLALQDMAYVASPRGICLRGDWTLGAPAEDDISVAASILNPLGQEIARADAEIARPDNVGTSQWVSGETGQTYHLLRLPDGAPPLVYDLSINVYSAAQPSGFDLLDEGGNPAGKNYAWPEAIAAQGLPGAFPATAVQSDNAGDGGSIETGRPFDVTLAIVSSASAGEFAPATAALTGDGWSLEQMGTGSKGGLLSWHRFIVPPGNGGEAILQVDGVEVARYTVIDVPRAFTPPEFEIAVAAHFPGVGWLVGVTVTDTTATPDNPPEVRLVWRTDDQTTGIAYTVFVQLLAEDGRLLAQSDSQPAGGERPTMGWVAGEYIVDPHRLRFNRTDYSGRAYLITGLYYGTTDGLHRMLTGDGADHVRLPVDMWVPPGTG